MKNVIRAAVLVTCGAAMLLGTMGVASAAELPPVSGDNTNAENSLILSGYNAQLQAAHELSQQRTVLFNQTEARIQEIANYKYPNPND